MHIWKLILTCWLAVFFVEGAFASCGDQISPQATREELNQRCVEATEKYLAIIDRQLSPSQFRLLSNFVATRLRSQGGPVDETRMTRMIREALDYYKLW